MNSSLKVVRDKNGYFRHPDGYPLVVIFDSKYGEAKRPDEILWQDPVIGLHEHGTNEVLLTEASTSKEKGKANAQPRKFINISRPPTRQRRNKWPIRAHATQTLKQCERGRGITSQSNGKEPAIGANSIPRQPSAFLDPFVTFPVRMEPYMYTLLHRYLSLSSQLAKPPEASQEWFSRGMKDAALFHSILSGSALYMDLITGRRDSLERFKHMKEAVKLLNIRFQGPRAEISDSTILVVAHLAHFEGTGDFTNWDLHMVGLYKIVQLRGGIAALDEDLKIKIRRADIIGCVGTLSIPRFGCVDGSSPSWHPLSAEEPLCDGINNIIHLISIDSNLVDTLYELQRLTSAIISLSIDIVTMDRIVASIQHRLLVFQYATFSRSQNNVLQETCCIGALVYLKTIYDFTICSQVGGFPTSALMDVAMIQRLKCCLDMVETDTIQTKELFIWMNFLGGALTVRTKAQAWFVARIAKSTTEWQICGWEDVKLLLTKFLWIDRIHESSYGALWDEAVKTRNVLPGPMGI